MSKLKRKRAVRKATKLRAFSEIRIRRRLEGKLERKADKAYRGKSYQEIARKIFPVEPLPQGAPPIYDKQIKDIAISKGSLNKTTIKKG